MPDTTEDMVADEAADAINAAAEPPSGPAQEFDLFEYFSIGSHVGKTLFANFTAALLRTVFGREVIIVRIESKGARSAGDIHRNERIPRERRCKSAMVAEVLRSNLVVGASRCLPENEVSGKSAIHRPLEARSASRRRSANGDGSRSRHGR